MSRADRPPDDPGSRHRALFFGGVLLRLLACAEAGGPASEALLLGTRHRQLVGGDVLGDDGAGTDDGAVADANRSDQCSVRADEGTGTDLRPIFAEAVVIAGDRAGADVRLGADVCIA